MTAPKDIHRRAVLLAAPSLMLSTGRSLSQEAQTPDIDAVAARAEGLEQLHSILVRQGGADLLARSVRGRGLDRVANIKSVSKTLVALLTGIAIERGLLEGPNARVLPLLGRAPAGDARDALTVGDLLSMRGGFETTSGSRYGAWVSSGDWLDFVLSGPLTDEPGGRYIYSTGGWHVLGALLTEVSGGSLLSLARDWLGAPLNIDFAPWVRDPQGYYLGGNDMALSPRDLARVGEMVVRNGAWDGAQVLPAAWIATSWRSRASSRWTGHGYGYGWFLTTFGERQAAYGRGYGGQMLAVVPELDLTVAITSDPTRPARTRGHFGDLLTLMDGVVRAAADAA